MEKNGNNNNNDDDDDGKRSQRKKGKKTKIAGKLFMPNNTGWFEK